MASITIIMPSYNKQDYIAQALDSVFMQQTTHDYHIIVADDHSTDKTLDIVRTYAQKYPNKITVLESDTNQHLYKNVLRAYAITKTDYFCVLDPDDFWIDKQKIQKAVDFLEEHPAYTIYVTDTLMQTPDGKRTPWSDRAKVIDSDFNDFLCRRAELGCTLGSTFRNVIFKHGVPNKMLHLEVPSQEQSFRGDTFRSLLHLHEGKAHCVPEKDAVYRITGDGLWQGSNALDKALLNATIFKDIWLYFDKKYPALLLLSRQMFREAKHAFLAQAENITDEHKLITIVKKLLHLKNIYRGQQDALYRAALKYSNPRNKLRLHWYLKLKNKLQNKGLLP